LATLDFGASVMMLSIGNEMIYFDLIGRLGTLSSTIFW